MRRLLVAVLLLSSALVVTHAQQVNLDAAMRAFWAAANVEAAERAVPAIVKSGANFDTVYARLKAGKTYAQEKTGVIRVKTSVNGQSLDNFIEIPNEYDPAQKWPLRVQLHGGVGRDVQEDFQPQSTRIPGEPQIYIEPHAYAEAAWWHTSQVDNIYGLLDSVKRKYNVDESRTYVTGISDGGTGVYFLAMRDPNPWSACLPLNGHPLVLANREARIEGNLYLGNLAHCPLYIVNGDMDHHLQGRFEHEDA